MSIIASLPIRGKTIQVEMLNAWTTPQGKVALARASADEIAEVLGLPADGLWSGKHVTFYIVKDGSKLAVKTSL